MPRSAAIDWRDRPGSEQLKKSRPYEGRLRILAIPGCAEAVIIYDATKEETQSALAELSEEVRGPEMCITLKHLHAFMASNTGNLNRMQTFLEQTRRCLVAQVVPSKLLDIGHGFACFV